MELKKCPGYGKFPVTAAMKLAGHDAWYKFWRGTADTDFDEQGAIAVYLAMREAFEATPYGVKTELPPEDAVQSAWDGYERRRKYGSFMSAIIGNAGSRASDRTPSTFSGLWKSCGAAIGPDLAPQGAPPHFHRRYSDSIYGPPTRYEMWPHRRSTDV